MPPIFIILFVVVIAIPIALILGFSIGRTGRFGLAGWLLASLVGAFAGWWAFGPGYEYFTALSLWDIPILPSAIIAALFVLAWLRIPGKKKP